MSAALQIPRITPGAILGPATSLRGYQSEMVGNIQVEFRNDIRRVLAVLATGGGKTRIFAYTTAATAARGKRVLILAHRKELIRQASEKLREAGVPQHGIVSPDFPMTNDPVQVASVQTLARRLGQPGLEHFDLIIADEAHHAVAGQWKTILEAYPKAFVLGVTATPERGDGKGLGVEAGGIFERMVTGPSIGWLIEQGYLCPSVVYAPQQGGPDLSGVRTMGGDFEAAALAEAMDRPSITGDAVEHYRRLASGRPAVAFCASVYHAEKVAEAFRAAGFRARAASGKTPAEERDAAINGLATGAVEVLCSCDLISEGLDVPAVACVILLRPTQSVGLFMQQIGRGMRPAPGKNHLIILDHAGNTLRHGMPDEAREWSLAGRKKKKGKPPTFAIKQCPHCFAMHRPAPKCPECGHIYETQVREVEEVAGELVALTPERLAEMRDTPTRDLLRPGISLDELRLIQRVKQYKPGWIYFVQRELRAEAEAKAQRGMMP
ncbi:DEAD/DEAH box helicase [Roseomonas gilardii]|nr:DEAD/DEAH box helicase [Roseomonas gilardii]